MKKLIGLSCVFVLLSVLSANANMVLIANIGDGVWANYPDSKLVIEPSQDLLLGVLDLSGTTQPGTLALGVASGGLGSLDASGVVTFQGVTATMKNDAIKAEALGIQNPFILMGIGPNQAGTLARNIVFHCNGQGDVTVYLIDDNTGQVLDSQVIHQVPEPMTLALLGIGGLAVARSRKRLA